MKLGSDQQPVNYILVRHMAMCIDLIDFTFQRNYPVVSLCVRKSIKVPKKIANGQIQMHKPQIDAFVYSFISTIFRSAAAAAV